jgi:shikimate kinase
METSDDINRTDSNLSHNNLYLVGFMAAGKTTLARALGKHLDWPTEDIDDLIEVQESARIADIFDRRGETYFRSVERGILHKLLPKQGIVVATGGGTFVDPDNRAQINRSGTSIWLDVPLGVILQRLPPNRDRPLAVDRKELAQLYKTRCTAYSQAHFRLDASQASLGELVKQTVKWLQP